MRRGLVLFCVLAGVMLVWPVEARALTGPQVRYQAETLSYSMAFDVLGVLMDEGIAEEDEEIEAFVGVVPGTCHVAPSRLRGSCQVFAETDSEYDVACRSRVQVSQRGKNLVPQFVGDVRCDYELLSPAETLARRWVVR